MTYARPCIVEPFDIDTLKVNDTAVGEESSTLHDKYKRSVEHFCLPYSRRWLNPVTRFVTLKTKWESESSALSSITEIVMHPAYQQIIGMGPVAIPLILSELKEKPGHWFWALKSITGEDPVLPDQRGRIKEMTEAWLRWGRNHGYVA